MPVASYRELIAWQKAMDLVVDVYQLSAGFPSSELYGLTNQVRRAAASVPSNIAEGQGRGIGGEFAHHLRIAQGSRQEVETQLLLATQLGFLPEGRVQDTLSRSEELGRVLSGLLRSVSPN